MKVVVDGVRPWRHDLAGCLHACAGTLFERAGVDPLDALGASWRFHYRRGDVRREEYYFPCPAGASLFEAIAPYHHAASAWRAGGDGWTDVRERVAAGTPVVVAVDNHRLPFRPAYRDVHSNHLVVIYGFDDERGTARVLDAIPPFFDGDVPIDVLDAARRSGNGVEHDRDRFFTDDPIGERWLDVDIRPGQGRLDRAATLRAIRRNVTAFRRAPRELDARDYDGSAGQARFLADMADRLERGEPVVDELFVVAGTALAAAAIHGDWLGRAGRDFDVPSLREIGRRVDRIAHHWSALRIIAGRARGDSARGGAASLRRRARALQADHDNVLGDLADTTSELDLELHGGP